MFHSVKGFFKIQFENKNLLSGLMALVKVFKCPGNVVLNSSCSDEPILISMNELQDHQLQPICQQLSNQLKDRIQKRYWPEIPAFLGLLTLGTNVIMELLIA
jgi:hypothetical protein